VSSEKLKNLVQRANQVPVRYGTRFAGFANLVLEFRSAARCELAGLWFKIQFGMKRVEIMIDEVLDAALDIRAEREGVSKAALVRRYVREGLHTLPRPHGDPLSDVVGMAKRGSPTDSSRIDEVAYDLDR
jgi:hypothetical protein